MPEDDKVIPVRVALRCRPLIPKEENEGCRCCLRFVPNEPQLILGQDKTFTYDFVFSPDTPQADVYEQTVSKLVTGFFKGYNATVLAYGQTGSGKTFTMGGGYGECSDPNDEINGIIPRVIRDLFRGVEERQEEYDTTIKVSYIELYKEDLHDLLQPVSRREPVQIREEATGGIKLVGLTEREVHDAIETVDCLESGAGSRTTGATAMNSQSSRSHAIFTIHMEKKSKVQDNDMCRAKFHLVDLAGSERAKKTQAEGERFKEGVNINKGLLALGNVISALGDDAQKRSHIPYRDSKLTRLLQDSLGGNSHTVMIACVSPADSNMEETLSTLRYADRARKIKNKPIVNRDPQAAEIMRLRQIVQDLQVQIMQGGSAPKPSSLTSVSSSASSSVDLSESMKTLRQKNDELEEEKYNLQKELRTTWAQNHVLTEQNISLEMNNEKLANILSLVKEKTGMSVSRLETTQSLHPTDVLEDIEEEEEKEKSDKDDALSMMKEIHQRITDSEKENPVSTSPTVRNKESDESPDASMTDDEQMSRQADYQRRLAELNDKLHQKQVVVKQMLQNDEAMDEMRKKYETDKTELANQIDKLNSERETLQELQNAKNSGGSATSKISEQRRKRLKELEEELTKARKTLRDQAKVVKMKEQSDQQLKKMTEDIREMKQSRVKLLRQMKEEADRFRQWKQAKDKEVIQLKAKDRKRQLEMVKLQRTNEKQQTVYRRKAEEAAAANKRLKEAMMRQKAVLDERNKKQEVNDSSGIGGRVRKWLSQELEVLVSVEEAKRHLEGLKQDRTDLAKQIKAAKNKLESGPSPSKRKMSEDGSAQSSDEGEDSIKKEIKMLEAEVELRSAQISDLQEKVMDAGQEEKTRTRWQNIHTMVEAKCAMKYLMNEAINAKMEESRQKSKLSDVKMKHDEAQKHSELLDKDLKQNSLAHEEEMLAMRKQYENKILYLLSQLNNTDSSSQMMEATRDEELKERLKFQEQEIGRLAGLEDELQTKIAENQKLQQEIAAAHCVLPSTVRSNSSLKEPCSIEESRFFSPALLKKVKAPRPSQEMLFESEEDDDDDDDDDDDKEDEQEMDPDWKSGLTPCGKLISRPIKRRTMTFKNTSQSDTKPEPDWVSPPALAGEGGARCQCKGKCVRYCDCKTQNRSCSSLCGCASAKCRNRARESIAEEDEDNTEAQSVLDSTYNVGDSQTETSEEMTEILAEKDSNRAAEPKSSSIKPVSSAVLFKENCRTAPDTKDPLNGGVKKKRKLLNDGKGYFGPIKP